MVVNMICHVKKRLINEWMDSIYHPVIEEDNSSNIAVIQPQKQTQHMLSLFKTFDSALMFENVCKIHVIRIVQPLT